jgi:hypothetical protein
MKPTWRMWTIGILALSGACVRPGVEELMKDYDTIPSASVPVPVLEIQVKSVAPVVSSAPPVASSSSPHSLKPMVPRVAATCGVKGKKTCPMQGWMQSVAGSAVFSGKTERLARAFNSIAGHPPPGMGQWGAICAAGAAKANAGDFDGAKAECGHCHRLYQSRYKASMRAMPWP